VLLFYFYMPVSVSSLFFCQVVHVCLLNVFCWLTFLIFNFFMLYSFSLKKEASSVLQSCGWSDKVHNFMSSRKRLCREAGNGPSSSSEFK
jgi:hypothetical protein